MILNMNEFRIIAIRPLHNCHQKFLKVLKPGQLYPFSNGFQFIWGEGSKGSEIQHVIPMDGNEIPTSLYQVGKINVQVSAIVGENGTGKSTITELIAVASYLLSLRAHIPTVKESKIKADHKAAAIAVSEAEKKIENIKSLDLEWVQDQLLKQDQNQDKGLSSLIADRIELYDDVLPQVEGARRKEQYLHRIIDAIPDLKNEVKLEIYFQIGPDTYRLIIDQKVEGDPNWCDIQQLFPEKLIKSILGPQKTEEEIFQSLNSSFFYTIMLNYSHYGLNEKELGPWLGELFHKNDAYQTPIVINPWRENGNININRENELVAFRLMVILFRTTSKDSSPNKTGSGKGRRVVGNRTAYFVRLSLMDAKIDRSWESRLNDLWPKVAEFFGINPKINRNEWDEPAKLYILQKLNAISSKYYPYRQYYENNGFKGNFKQFLTDIQEDTSHITFKVKQAINYLKHSYGETYFEAKTAVPIETIVAAVESYSADPKTMLEYVPPSFLNLEISFEEKNQDWTNTFDKLSSGEKQNIYALSSMIYHLVNLDSVNERNMTPQKYQNVNILFDEIEMYYHPELQRGFIKDFLEAVEIANLTHIKGINATFITHSPFIMSDIPRHNTLRLKLEDGTKKSIPLLAKENTFGANIHQLLASAFFLQSSTGEFAEEVIQDIIDFLRGHESKRIKSRKEAQKHIDLIGEPLIRNELQRMLDRQRVRELENRVAKLEESNERSEDA